MTIFRFDGRRRFRTLFQAVTLKIVFVIILKCLTQDNDSSKNMQIKETIKPSGDIYIQLLSANDLERLKRVERGPPIVVPRYKLIFFWNQKSACSYWKRVFQYIQGIPRKQFQFIHTPERSGLKYLDNYSNKSISQMMNDPTWIKATFVREPRERLLSAYLDKAIDNSFILEKCNRSVKSFAEFIELTRTCKDPHWESQVRLPQHYYKHMIVGVMENLPDFTEKLLRKVGAWNDTVRHWLQNRKRNDLVVTRMHATNAKNKILKYYTHSLEKKIVTRYQKDYDVFGFDRSLLTLK